mgnify:CR=1 FL=1
MSIDPKPEHWARSASEKGATPDEAEAADAAEGFESARPDDAGPSWPIGEP